MYFLKDLLAKLSLKMRSSEMLPLELGVLLLNDNSKRGRCFDDFLSEFSAACERGNLAFVFDGLGIFLGHIAWRQHLADIRTIQGEVDNGTPPIKFEQTFDITDFGVTAGNFFELFFFLRSNLFSAGVQVKYERRRTVIGVSKQKVVKCRSKDPLAKTADTELPFFLTAEGADIKHAILLFVEEALLVGKAIMLIGQDSQISGCSISNILDRVHTPFVLEQAELFFDRNEEVVGFVSWAWVEDLESDWLLSAGNRKIEQWNYGEFLCICDVIAAPGYEDLVINFIRNKLHVDEEILLCSAADRGYSQHRSLNRATVDIRDFANLQHADAAI